MYHMHYQHLIPLLQAAQKNIKKVLGRLPPLQLPHGKQKGYQDSLQEGTYQRHFHQINLAVAICLSTKQSADGRMWQTRRALCARATAILRAVGVLEAPKDMRSSKCSVKRSLPTRSILQSCTTCKPPTTITIY